MKRRRHHISTPEAAREAREALGLGKTELARLLRLDPITGRRTVLRIESGKNARGVPGPYQLALEALLAGWRPIGARLPIDKE